MATTSPSLLVRLRDRADADAWGRLARLYTPLLLDWVRRLGVQPADADDLVQEVLTTVAKEMPAFEYDPARGAFRGWLRTVLANRVRHHRRTRGRAPDAAGGGGHDRLLADLEDAGGALSAAWDVEHDRHVAGRLLALIRGEFEVTTWEAFRLAAVEGRPAAEVATALGITPNAVRVARCRVLARLRQEADGLTG
ncbi:MAG: sigma-70 family RNA polymerase sigma factor [Gemmataceae bacterium]|nr:sigma-70 family RNA polymerase sigma factor [Gemmataceae bacterium]